MNRTATVRHLEVCLVTSPRVLCCFWSGFAT